VTVLVSKPGYVSDLVYETQELPVLQDSIQDPSGQRPIYVDAHDKLTPRDDDVSSVHQVEPFSPNEERERRWLEFEQAMELDTGDASGDTHTTSDAVGHSGNVTNIVPERVHDDATARSLQLMTHTSPAPTQELSLSLDAHLSQMSKVTHASSHAGTTDPRLPEPQRIPPHPPLYAPSELHCSQCQRLRPPRAHHCRRCGTCVLRMDHHCPWIGGCVGARNYSYYFNTVLWGFVLSTYTIISMAPLFARGVRSLGSGAWSEWILGWNVDGFMISLFVVSAFFWVFTCSLVIVHVQMSSRNVTSVEQRSLNDMRTREGIVLRRYYSVHGQGGTLGKGPLGMIRRYFARHRKLKAWNQRWGHPNREGHPWWIGNSAELAYGATSSSALTRETDLERSLGLSHDALHKCHMADRPLEQRQHFTRPACLLNMELSLGPPWSWVVPLAPRDARGVHFPLNPRYSQLGEWLPREAWPAVVAHS